MIIIEQGIYFYIRYVCILFDDLIDNKKYSRSLGSNCVHVVTDTLQNFPSGVSYSGNVLGPLNVITWF